MFGKTGSNWNYFFTFFIDFTGLYLGTHHVISHIPWRYLGIHHTYHSCAFTWNICSKNLIEKLDFFISICIHASAMSCMVLKSVDMRTECVFGNIIILQIYIIYNSSPHHCKADVHLANQWMLWTCIRRCASVSALLSLIKARQRHALNKQQAQQSTLFTFQRNNNNNDYIITTVHPQGTGYFKWFSHEVCVWLQ